MSDEMKEVVPGVHLPASARRLLKSGDPRGDDYREAHKWVRNIRSRLSHIRGELHDIGKLEAISEHDRTCEDVAGALTLCLVSLHRLVEGDHSLELRAHRLDELWADVAAHPEDYVIEDGVTFAKRGQKEDQEWDWKASGIFERGGRRPSTDALYAVAKERADAWNVCDPESVIKPDAVRAIVEEIAKML